MGSGGSVPMNGDKCLLSLVKQCSLPHGSS
jgi:hypothetical protein